MSPSAPQTEIGASQAPIHMTGERLAVEIAAPGSVYRGTRFDWTAFITQVTLDGKHTFCVLESFAPGQGTGGIGLCNEFGNQKVIGYSEAQPGESYPKLGIGLLERDDADDYNFFRSHTIKQPFPIRVEAAPEKVVFVVEPVECRGYAVRLTKTVTVKSNCLKIAYQLENTGQKPIHTHEYCHNFVGIDQHPIGPDYRLHLPYPIKVETPPQTPRRMNQDVVIDGENVTLRAIPQWPFFFLPQGFSKSEGPQWELTHQPSGVGMREYDDFTPEHIAVWGTTHVISAEVYISNDIEPGETQRWSRSYEFFD
jgi:hypothetical protein